MKLNRSALMAGVLAIGVAACGDDVQVVQPTPEPPPPPPAVTASMAPASASVLIGNSVVFAVNASGGVAGDAASWTCASSNSGIATVSVVSAGCQATGVVAGSVTITATVTKSGETVNVGAQLTVTEEAAGEPAFLILKSVTGEDDADGNPTDASGLKGRVTVNLGVERGDQTLERLSVLIDGEVAAYQSFGSSMGMAAPEDDAAAEQAVYDFTLAFDSDGYEPHGDHADVDYRNGEYSLSAELQIAGGMMADGMMGHETITSNIMTVTFNNDDGYVVTADLGENSHLASDGRRWYGGPSNGHIMVSALPVSYSGDETGVVTVTLTDCTGEAAEGDDDDHDHGAAGLSFEFDCKKETANRTIAVLEGGEATGMILNEDLPKPNIDMVGPTNAPIIIANRNGREEGWINAAAGISGKYHASRGKDNWLVEGEDETEGVGGYNMGIRIGSNLKAAVRAGTSSLPAESDGNDAYCAVAVAMDDLGNMASLPDTTGTAACRTAPDGADRLWNHDVATDADGDSTANVYGFSDATENLDDDTTNDVNVTDLSVQHLAFGVDTTAPVIELGADDYDTRTADISTSDFTGGLDFEPADDESDTGNSGLHSANSLQVKAERRTASATQCVTVGDDGAVAAAAGRNRNCSYKAISDTNVNVEARTGEEAYWTISGQAHDKAGNSSTVASHTFAYDNMPARATPPAVPGAVTAGMPFQGATYLNDGLSIRDYYGTMNYGGTSDAPTLSLGIGMPIAVDAFNAATLTNVNHAVTASVGIVTTAGTTNPYAAVQAAEVADVAGSTDALLPINGVTVGVRDQAGAYVPQTAAITDASVSGQVADSLGFVTDKVGLGTDGFDFVFAGTATTYTVCGYAKCENVTGTSAPPPATVEIKVRATADALGAFRDPFERVDFWMTDANGVAWLVASDASGASGRVGGTDAAEARKRTWTYSATLAGTALRAATRPGTAATDDTDIGKIVAIGVSSRGVGLFEIMDAAVEFGTEDDD